MTKQEQTALLGSVLSECALKEPDPRPHLVPCADPLVVNAACVALGSAPPTGLGVVCSPGAGGVVLGTRDNGFSWD